MTGSHTPNVVPAPSTLSTPRAPPCLCTMPCTIPVPSRDRRGGKERLEHAGARFREILQPVSATAKHTNRSPTSRQCRFGNACTSPRVVVPVLIVPGKSCSPWSPTRHKRNLFADVAQISIGMRRASIHDVARNVASALPCHKQLGVIPLRTFGVAYLRYVSKTSTR